MIPRLRVAVALAALAAGCGSAGGTEDAGDVSAAPDAVADVTTPDASDASDAAADARVDVLPPDATAPDAALAPVLYPADRDQSPLTASVAAQLRAIAARDPALDAHEFAKVGDSQTVSTYYMHCFSAGPLNWDGRTAFVPTVTHFRAGAAGGTDPFRRDSLSAVVGWSAWAPLRGTPSPLQQEFDAIHPRYAVVMFGSNDTQSGDPFGFGENMLNLVDWLSSRGVIPVLSSVPPRGDLPSADAWVPVYSAVVRAIAQARQLPFVDIERQLRPIPGFALGGDHLHLNAYTTGAPPYGCNFNALGLQYGQNIRNLLMIEGLSRALGAVQDNAAPDASAPTLRGQGTSADPFVIAQLPFSDVRDTATGGHRTIDTYAGCMAAQDESGAEFTYRLDVTAPTRVRAMVLDRGTVDVDVHLLDATNSGAGCVQRNDRVIVADLAPGTHYFSLDTFVSGGAAHAGEYIFVVTPE